MESSASDLSWEVANLPKIWGVGVRELLIFALVRWVGPELSGEMLELRFLVFRIDKERMGVR